MGASTSLDLSLPDDVIDEIARYLVRRDYLGARAASTGCKEETRRAIARWPAYRRHLKFEPRPEPHPDGEAQETRVEPHVIVAVGRVFGPNLHQLTTVGRSPETIDALRSLVSGTNGTILSLDLRDAAISSDVLLEICRACPKLDSLNGPDQAQISDATIRDVALACPELSFVDFKQTRRDALSPPETWARHFPHLEYFSLHNGTRRLSSVELYRPTVVEVISQTARMTKATYLDVDRCHITREVIEAIVGTPFGDQLESLGDDDPDYRTRFEPDALLAAVAGFPNLTELNISEENSLDQSFYVSLGLATSNITVLKISDRSCTDACIAAAARLPLRELCLDSLYDVTRHVVDGILAGVAATTLVEFGISDYYEYIEEQEPFRAVDVLRLCRGCPKLKSLRWHCLDTNDDREFINHHAIELRPGICREIADLLVSRGGEIDVQPEDKSPYVDGGVMPHAVEGDFLQAGDEVFVID